VRLTDAAGKEPPAPHIDCGAKARASAAGTAGAARIPAPGEKILGFGLVQHFGGTVLQPTEALE